MPCDLTFDAWVIRLGSAGDAPDAAEALGLLDDAERERAGRFVHEIDRRRYVSRRAAYRRILACYLGVAPALIEYARAPGGKPSIAPSAARTLQFNVSSCGDLALIVVGGPVPVGADIEAPRLRANPAPLARGYYSGEECAACIGTDGEVAIEPFLRVWTRKEAFLKLTGLGLVDDLPNVRVGAGGNGETGHYVEPSGATHSARLHTQPLAGSAAVLSIAAPTETPFAVRLIEYRHEALQGNA